MTEYKKDMWYREGDLIFILKPAGWDGGKETLTNRLMVRVEACRDTPKEEAEALAAVIYDHLIAAEQAEPVDGAYVMVPREITPEMQQAYFRVIDKNLDRVQTDAAFGRYSSNQEAYRAMIAAAPIPHAEQEAKPSPLAFLDSPEVVGEIASVMSQAYMTATQLFTYRQTMDKSEFEVIEWPDPDVAANDKQIAVYAEMHKACDHCHDLRNKYVSRVILSTLRHLSQPTAATAGGEG